MAKTGTYPLNGPIMRQNKVYRAIFYFRLCDPTLQLTQNDLCTSRTCKQGNPRTFRAFWGYLHLSGSIIVTKTTSGFNSDHIIRQYARGLLLESPFVPSSTNCWAVRAKTRQNGCLDGRRGKTGSRNMVTIPLFEPGFLFTLSDSF